MELRVVGSGEVLGVTTSHSLGLAVGVSSQGPGIYAAGFYTATLGPAAGQALTGSLNFSVYPTASVEQLAGWGASAGAFLTPNPAGINPFGGSVNVTNFGDTKLGGSYPGPEKISFGAGGGAYVEASYTFMTKLYYVGDLSIKSHFVNELARKSGLSNKYVLQLINELKKRVQKNPTGDYRVMDSKEYSKRFDRKTAKQQNQENEEHGTGKKPGLDDEYRVNGH